MKLCKLVAINSLIVFYVGIMYFTGVPETNVFNARMKMYANQVAMAVGIWPSWSMFAPNPIKFDSKTFVTVSFKDGSNKFYDLEKPLSGPFAVFRKARWMKFSQDNIRSPQQRALLGPVVRHIYYKYNTKENPVTNITLKRRWFDIPAIEKAGVFPIDRTPRNMNETVLISHNI